MMLVDKKKDINIVSGSVYASGSISGYTFKYYTNGKFIVGSKVLPQLEQTMKAAVNKLLKDNGYNNISDFQNNNKVVNNNKNKSANEIELEKRVALLENEVAELKKLINSLINNTNVENPKVTKTVEETKEVKKETKVVKREPLNNMIEW